MAVEQTYILVEEQAVPVKIYRERRRSVRASVGRQHFILRMPQGFTKAQEKRHKDWFKNWITEIFQTRIDIKNKFKSKVSKTGDTLQVGERHYELKIEYQDRRTHAATLKNDIIHIKLSNTASSASYPQTIKRLMSRVVAQDFLPAIEQRVNQLNEQYIKKSIKKVSLKYNQSNWGSCSSKGNINLSTRLLFAPPKVIDYVILHELAHLVIMNHSEKFWAVISKAMPDYKLREQWLKENGAYCDF